MPEPSQTTAPAAICDTTLTSDALAGDREISIVSAEGCQAGDIIVIAAGTDHEETVVLGAETSPTTLELATPLDINHAEGETVIEVASGPGLEPAPTASPSVLPSTGGPDSSAAGDNVGRVLAGLALILAAGVITGVMLAERRRR